MLSQNHYEVLALASILSMSSLTVPIPPNESSVDHHRSASDLRGSDLFTNQSAHNDAPKVKRPHNERIMEPLPFNQRSLATCEDSDVYATPRLPPVVHHMSCYAKRSRPRFRPYQLGGNTPTALEHRFTSKYLLKRSEADMSLVDVQKVLNIIYTTDHAILIYVIPGQGDI